MICIVTSYHIISETVSLFLFNENHGQYKQKITHHLQIVYQQIGTNQDD